MNMTMKKQAKKKETKKTIKPRKGGSVVLDKSGKTVSNSNDLKSKLKEEDKSNAG